MNAAAVAAACGRAPHFYPSCDSTNRVARALAEAGAPAGALVVADAQTAGRGRLGRTWASPPGVNLYFSLVLRPALAPAQAPLLSLAAAAGAADVLAAQGVRIKWPNDLLGPDGGKLAGVLAEAEIAAGRLVWAVIGVGVNVNQRDFPPELAGATSLALLGGPRDRAALLGQLVAAIEARAAALERDPGPLLATCRARSATLGREVAVGEVAGRAVDIREDGALLIDTGESIVPVLSGDLEG